MRCKVKGLFYSGSSFAGENCQRITIAVFLLSIVLDEDGIIQEDLNNPLLSEVLQRELYYPFGLQLRGTAPLTPNPNQDYLYNGKEQIEGTGLYAYGFRYYDPVIGRFTGVDPIAEQFAFVSGFNYVLNNPIILVDPDGRAPKTVTPTSDVALQYIKQGLTVNEASYVQLDANGNVDAAYLRQGLAELGEVGGNYTALLDLAYSPDITEVIVAEGFLVKNHNGGLDYQDMGEVSVTSPADDMWSIEGEAYLAAGISKDEYIKTKGYSTEPSVSGWLGVTLYGDTPKGQSYGRSSSGNTQVIINSRSPTKIGVKNQAHENYGHNYFRIQGRPSGHGEIKSRTSNASNNNRPLEIQIWNRQQEAGKNYDAQNQ